MKPAGILLLIPAGLVSVLAAEDAPTTGLASREIKAHIREGLPAFQPPSPRKEDTGDSEPAENPAPGTLVLPKMTVKEKRLPPDAADHLMSKRDFNRKMRNLDYDDLAKDGPLEAWLNSFAIPIFGPSMVDRGRALARGQELDRIADLLSPQEAKTLNGMYDELALVIGRRAPKRR